MPRNRFLARLLPTVLLACVVLMATPAAHAAPAKGGKARAGLAEAVSLSGEARKAQKAHRAQKAAARPATGSSDLLFDGSRISAFANLQAADGAITEVPDPAGSGETVFDLNVDESDVYPVTPTDNPRAQALSPPIIRPGDEFWLRTKFMLPADMPEVDGWMSLVAIYGAPFAGPGPWEIEIAGDEIHWMRNGTYDWDVPWSMPLVKGRWVEILLHERFGSDGWVEMWVDGQPVSFFGREQRLSMQTMDESNNGGANEAKIMQYREAGMFDSASVYFGALKVGKTRASVGG